MYCCREFQKYKITEKSNYWLVSLESSKSWELENGDICSVCMNYRTRRIWGNHSLESMFLVSGITQEHSTLLVLTGPGFNLRREKKQKKEGRQGGGEEKRKWGGTNRVKKFPGNVQTQKELHLRVSVLAAITAQSFCVYTRSNLCLILTEKRGW